MPVISVTKVMQVIPGVIPNSSKTPRAYELYLYPPTLNSEVSVVSEIFEPFGFTLLLPTELVQFA